MWFAFNSSLSISSTFLVVTVVPEIGLSTTSQVPFSRCSPNSSWIAASHSSRFGPVIASSYELGSAIPVFVATANERELVLGGAGGGVYLTAHPVLLGRICPAPRQSSRVARSSQFFCWSELRIALPD